MSASPLTNDRIGFDRPGSGALENWLPFSSEYSAGLKMTSAALVLERALQGLDVGHLRAVPWRPSHASALALDANPPLDVPVDLLAQPREVDAAVERQVAGWRCGSCAASVGPLPVLARCEDDPAWRLQATCVVHGCSYGVRAATRCVTASAARVATVSRELAQDRNSAAAGHRWRLFDARLGGASDACRRDRHRLRARRCLSAP